MIRCLKPGPIKNAFLRSGGDEYNIDKFIGRFI